MKVVEIDFGQIERSIILRKAWNERKRLQRSLTACMRAWRQTAIKAAEKYARLFRRGDASTADWFVNELDDKLLERKPTAQRSACRNARTLSASS